MNSQFTIAVHSLVLLAHRPDRMATSEMIAENVCTHPARVRKVMGLLRKNGYITAKEGAGGGFLLSCPPDEVRLSELYNLTSAGSLKPNWCSGKTDDDCIVSGNMKDVMASLFLDAEQQLVLYFRRWTIQDVLDLIKQRQASRTD